MIVIMLLMFEPKIRMPEDGGKEVNLMNSAYPEPKIVHDI